MLIDWFTVGAQIINFLILVWLLKRYLYRPILSALDAREKDIAARQAATVDQQQQSRNERERFQKETADLEAKRRASMEAAEKEAQTERTRLLHEATREADELRAARRKALEDEMTTSRDELLQLVRREIIALTRKILLDLTSVDLERASLDVFLRRLKQAETNNGMPVRIQPAANDLAPAHLRSPFALSSSQQEAVKLETQKKFHTSQLVIFEIAPELGLGIELTVQDQKFAWTIDDYLTSFEARIAELSANEKS